MWNVLDVRYEVLDAGIELYVIEKFHDYKVVDDCFVVEQAH
jgi:hypothetical protein